MPKKIWFSYSYFIYSLKKQFQIYINYKTQINTHHSRVTLTGNPYNTIAQPFRFGNFKYFLAYWRHFDKSIYF